MRRLISAAVQVRPEVPLEVRLVDPASVVRPPTDEQVRESMMKVRAEVMDLVTQRTGGASGWDIGDLECSITTTGEGEVILRGSVTIERAD